MVYISVVIIVIITRCLWFCFMAGVEFGLTWVHFSSPAVWLAVFSLSCLAYSVGPGICSRNHSSGLDLITFLEGKQVTWGNGRESFYSSWSFCGSSTFWKLPYALLYWVLGTVVDHSGGSRQTVPIINPTWPAHLLDLRGPVGGDPVACSVQHSSSDSVSRQHWGSPFPVRVQLSDTDILIWNARIVGDQSEILCKDKWLLAITQQVS